jgi:hypothetical protein
MDINNAFTADETRCDSCGTPTPRLTPPQDIELCDSCAKAQEPNRCLYCNTECSDAYCSDLCAINASVDNQEDR